MPHGTYWPSFTNGLGPKSKQALRGQANSLEADCMNFQPFLGWRPASTTQFNKIITGAKFSLCKGLRVKKLGRFNKSIIIQRI
jgi:hypothetical protein